MYLNTLKEYHSWQAGLAPKAPALAELSLAITGAVHGCEY
jgi:hypothetical protein